MTSEKERLEWVLGFYIFFQSLVVVLELVEVKKVIGELNLFVCLVLVSTGVFYRILGRWIEEPVSVVGDEKMEVVIE